MPRNFFRRIEVIFPIEDGALRERITSEMLALLLADNTKARYLQPNGVYRLLPPKKNVPARTSQNEFIKLALGKPVTKSKPRKPKYPEVRLARGPARS
jgi:polyphosphate kinase